jgi:outer membrane protein assembly factor BamB
MTAQLPVQLRSIVVDNSQRARNLSSQSQNFPGANTNMHAGNSCAPKVVFWAAALSFTVLTCDRCSASESRWPQFRGPFASGISEGDKPPTRFGPDSNLLWRVAMAAGLSSPCIWGERIFLTTYSEGKLATVCLNRQTGATLWQRTAPAEKIESFHPAEGSPATATPATDGTRVVVYFGSCGVLAYDFEGKELWRLALPTARQVGDFGSGTSPVLVRDVVLLNRDQMEGSELLAIDAKTGAMKWRADRSTFKSSFGTPAVWSVGQDEEVVLQGALQLVSYHLPTGKERWRLHGLPSATCTTPVVAHGLLYFVGWSAGKGDAPMPPFATLAEQEDKNHDGVIASDEAKSPMVKTLFASLDTNHDQRLTKEEWDAFVAAVMKGENVAMAIRPGGRGDISETHVAWKYFRGLPYVASPLVYRGNVYFVRDGGMLTCLNAASGEPVYEQERVGAPGSYYSSPVAANGVIYLCSVNGVVTSVRAGPKFEVIAKNNLKERIAATPAIADDTLYVRTDKHLYAFKSRR